MKVTLKKITVTTIISFAVYVSLMLMLFSCRTAKKEWVKENFTEKAELQSIQDNLTYSTEEVKAEIRNSLISEFSEKLKQQAEKTTNNESETTTVKGSIIAEEGKEKSATVGNTTIKSNGANVTFETTSTKALSKEFETKYNQLNQKLEQELKYNKYMYTEINSLKSEIADLRSTYQSEKQAKTKETTKRGFTFWAVIIGGLIVVLGVAGYIFRSNIQNLYR